MCRVCTPTPYWIISPGQSVAVDQDHAGFHLAAARVGLSPEQVSETLDSGQTKANNRIGWALSGLVNISRRPRSTPSERTCRTGTRSPSHTGISTGALTASPTLVGSHRAVSTAALSEVDHERVMAGARPGAAWRSGQSLSTHVVDAHPVTAGGTPAPGKNAKS